VTREVRSFLPNLVLVAAVLGVSTSGLFIRLAESPSLVIATYRMVFVTALLILPLMLAGREDLARAKARDVAQLVASGLFLAAHFGLWTASLQFTSVASSVVLVSTHPAFVALAEASWLGRVVPGLGILGIVLTMLGSVVIAIDELSRGGANALGCVLALGGAVSMVGYLIIGRTLRAHLGLMSYTTVVYGVCAVALGAASVISGASLVPPVKDIPLFLALAVVPTICGHTLFNWTLRHLPASIVSTAFLGEPVGASLLAWAFLAEVPAPATVLGGSIILIGLFLTLRSA
jgi:drug/metabolite transporter (DMT)-like permease